MLGHDAKGSDSESFELAYVFVGKQEPESLLDEVGHFFTKELVEFVGGLVGASGDGLVYSLL